MRPNEAKRIGESLARFDAVAISPCLNLGSSTGSFRTREQPHIDAHIFAPLQRSGVRVIHADLKAAEGVDLAGDIYDDTTMDAILGYGPRCVICCNMFEHVLDREALAARIDAMLPSGGLLIVTVPYSYPIHYDPIDTYYRPSPDEIYRLFPHFEMVDSEVISDTTYLQELLMQKGAGGVLLHFAKSAVKSLMFWKDRQQRVLHFHRYLWLFRPYRVSYAAMRKL